MNSLTVNYTANALVKKSQSIVIPGDKSLSHRSVIFASLAQGQSTIENLLVSEDIFRTMDFFKALGVFFAKDDKNNFIITSKGYNAFNVACDQSLEFYMGNSGTSCRLLMGLAAGLNVDNAFIFSGDASLRRRPMLRVIEPLVKMGAIISHNEGKLPVKIKGNTINKSVEHNQEVASAQVKSAILLAALVAGVKTTYIEPIPTRNHTENIMQALNIDIRIDNNKITLNNNTSGVTPLHYKIPGDFSSAAFFIVLALITDDCEIVISDVLLNPLRTGLLVVLRRMGANIIVTNEKIYKGELIGNLIVKSSCLKGVEVEKELASSLIDEYPILACACACANGKSIFYGIEELKYKESNRAQTICDNLCILGIAAQLKGSTIMIEGGKSSLLPGKVLNSNSDHRIAMAFAVLATIIKGQTKIVDTDCINTSFPTFVELMRQLNINIIELM